MAVRLRDLLISFPNFYGIFNKNKWTVISNFVYDARPRYMNAIGYFEKEGIMYIVSFSEAGGQLSKENDFLKFTHQDIPHSNSNQGRIIQIFPEGVPIRKGRRANILIGQNFPKTA